MGKTLKKQSKKLLLSIAVVVLALVVTVALLVAFKPSEDDPFREDAKTSQTDKDTSGTSTEPEEKSTPDETPAQESGEEVPVLDPETVGSLDIEPIGLTISYVKGIGGFEYEVLRTPSGTRYVEFRSSDLVGTKCTNDKGAFASVLVSPQGSESATLSKKKTIEATEYGLSLVAANCTSNSDRLSEYQKSFSDAFHLLKEM